MLTVHKKNSKNFNLNKNNLGDLVEFDLKYFENLDDNFFKFLIKSKNKTKKENIVNNEVNHYLEENETKLFESVLK